MRPVGFIGLGRMGYPIAQRLALSGVPLVTLLRHKEGLDAQGWPAVTTPKELAKECRVVFTCLPSPQASLDVYLGSDGLLEGAPQGALLIELSTIDPGTAKRIAAECTTKGVRFLDAPVSGGPKGAVEGKLTLMVGGDSDAFDEARELFSLFGAKLFHMGQAGAGSATKMCNQMLTGVTHLLVSEAVVLGKKFGLDLGMLFEVLHSSSGQSNSLDRALPNFIIPRKFEAAFALDGIYKDLECISQTGKQLGVRLLLIAVAQQAYEEARAMGVGGQDVAAIHLAVERASGL